jgi:ABC-type bacteriocin/lantibiotic exporter with double-glycine peptidase domain
MRRVPFVAQHPAKSECGLACLAMILAYHQRTVSLNQLSRGVAMVPGGIDAAELISTAGRWGLDGAGIRVRDSRDLAVVEPPCILHWEASHYVVFEGLAGDQASIVDPRSGRRRIDFATLAKNFSGTALVFTPTHPPEALSPAE